MPNNTNVFRVPAETSEFEEISVTVDGEPVTAGLSYTLTTGNDRPAAWAPVDIQDGKTGILVHNLDVGEYRVWVRVGTAVRHAGFLVIY